MADLTRKYYFVEGNWDHQYREKSAARKAAQRIANATGRSVRLFYRFAADDYKHDAGTVQPRGRSNPGRKLTKAQRKVAASKAAKKRGLAKALQGLLKKVNPSMKCAGAQLKKNKGGSITIIPVKLPKR